MFTVKETVVVTVVVFVTMKGWLGVSAGCLL
jgi:hypothetical protein